ncbi:NADH-quinone oxidoreductase subunit NuoE [Sunxiuqinia indica]|uniref:NADH-quinone oxidoreductase subunit NuoE n=1 Tax=Sunxiuqinia indica TaxID=2692584 RepID=UPI001356FB97|nr:NADH-quinone oxidoreductase subunit NuoE [Sunxiuqinia indica]
MPKIKLAENTINQIKEICAQFDNQEGELINVLHQVQNKLGYLPAEVQEVIAKELKMSLAKVYGVVTFYSFFTMLPQGEHPISICMGTACYVRGAEQVLTEFKRQLNIEVGQTSPDGKFSLSSLRCVGACGLAPVVTVGEKVYGRVSPQQVSKIIAEYQQGCPSEAKSA